MNKARGLGGALTQLKHGGAQVCDLGPKQHICSGPAGCGPSPGGEPQPEVHASATE